MHKLAQKNDSETKLVGYHNA